MFTTFKSCHHEFMFQRFNLYLKTYVEIAAPKTRAEPNTVRMVAAALYFGTEFCRMDDLRSIKNQK